MPNRQKSEQDQINYLAGEISRHRYLYYNEEPEISDAQYDILEDSLRELDPNNPILFKIGVDSSEIFTKRQHIIPMMSQDKVTQPNEFIKWARKRNYMVFLVQYKLDGISIELQYDKGIFQYALTRGDGKIGDDVSANVTRMKGYISKLKSNFTGAVRAEVLLYHNIFEQKYNDKQNCRNATSGLVRRKDGIGSGDLNLIFYDAISITEDITFQSEIQKLHWLKQERFPTILTKTVKTPQEVIKIREDVMNNKRNSLGYDIDGLVIKGKVIDLEDMKRAKPMSQIAFKFHAEEIETVVKKVEWSISGHIYTPVAIVEPVRLMGTTVSRASLANPNLIKDLELKIGSEVFISKRGDIIPKIESVIKTPVDAEEITLPTTCEVCDTTLKNEGTRLICPNESCPKRAYHRLVKWIKKLNIKHFSEKLLLKPLFQDKKISTIADLYNLKVSDLTKLAQVKETSAKKALDNLFAVKEISLAKFIGGFDIENIGEDLTKRVVDAGYNTLEKIRNASNHQLSQVDGFADLTAQYLKDGIEVLYPQMKELLNTKKITITGVRETGGKLEGKSFCITGSLENFKPRSKAEELVIKLGGTIKKNVTKDLDYLVTNSDEPTKKYTTAQGQENTKIISEDEFLELVE